MAMIIQVEIPHDRYAEIEEYCLNKGISIPTYFVVLHEMNIAHDLLFNKERNERMMDFHKKFEALAKHEIPENVNLKENQCQIDKESLPDALASQKEKKSRKKS